MPKQLLPKGECWICGQYGELTYEHIPPQKAFNNKTYLAVDSRKTPVLGPDDDIKGILQQGGIGAYTLCSNCNNTTGSWYGGAYVDWSMQAMELLKQAKGRPSLLYPYNIYPLRVIKQVVTIVFSLNKATRTDYPELVEFVLTRDSRLLPSGHRIYAYYNLNGHPRRVGKAMIVKGNGKIVKYTGEFSHPPFGFVMTFDSERPDERLVDISDFVTYVYDDLVPLNVNLPVLPTYMHLPNDYRTRQEIEMAYTTNVLEPYGRLKHKKTEF